MHFPSNDKIHAQHNMAYIAFQAKQCQVTENAMFDADDMSHFGIKVH